jgi:hypothetical protein
MDPGVGDFRELVGESGLDPLIDADLEELMMITVYFHIVPKPYALARILKAYPCRIGLQRAISGPNWRAPPSPRSGRVAKQQVCAADRGRAAQSVATQPVQTVDCGRIFSSGVTYSGVA